MRRFISSILAILVLVLSCFPCSDVDAMPMNGQRVETIIKAAPVGDGCDNHTNDICSPFCTCSCCSGFTIPAMEPIAFEPAPVYLERAYASYLSEAVREIALPIWQPPQLV